MSRPVTVTAVNGAQKDATNSKFGSASLTLTGNQTGQGDVLQLEDSTFFDFASSSDLTIDCWIYMTDAFAGNKIFTNEWGPVPSSQVGYSLGLIQSAVNASQLEFRSQSGQVQTLTEIFENQWTHIAVTYEGISNNLTLYINGNFEASTQLDFSYNSGSPEIPVIGANSNDLSEGFTGNIDEFRISNKLRYQTNFAVETSAYTDDDDTLLLLHMDGTNGDTNFTDDYFSLYRPTIGLVGFSGFGFEQITTSESRFGNASVDLANGALQLSTDSPFNFSTSDPFTIETWIYPSGLEPTNTIFANHWPAAPGDEAYKLSIQGSNLVFETSNNLVFGNTIINDGQWTHVAVVYDGSNNLSLYVNGQLDAQGVVSINVSSNPELPTIASETSSYQSDPFPGFVDEFRISSVARYDLNTSFTLQTSPFVNDNDTLALFHFDGTSSSTVFRDDVGGRRKIGVSSLNGAFHTDVNSIIGSDNQLWLDSLGQLLQLGEPEPFDFSNSDPFTIETWIYPQDNFNFHTIFANHWSGFDRSYVFQLGNQRLHFSTNNQTVTSNSFINTNSWTHVAVTNDGTGLIKLWINGQLDAQGSVTINVSSRVDKPTIGTDSEAPNFDSQFRGFMDEFRVSSVERYTSNFSTQTQAFEDDADTILLLNFDGAVSSTDFVDNNLFIPQGEVKEFDATVTASFSPSLTVTIIKTTEILLDVSTSMLSDASILRGVDSLLEFFADLDAQAAVLYDSQLALSTSAQITANVESFTFVNLISSTFTAESTLTARPISYGPRQFVNNNRPNDFIPIQVDPETIILRPTALRGYDTTDAYAGVASYDPYSGTGQAIQSDIGYAVTATDNFAFEAWWKVNDVSVTGTQDQIRQIYVGGFPRGRITNRVDDEIGGFAVGIDSFDRFIWGAQGGSTTGSPQEFRVTNTVVPEAQWFHIAVTRQSGTYRLYLNNVEIDSFFYDKQLNINFANNTTKVILWGDSFLDARWDNVSFRVGASDIIGYSQPISQDPSTYVVATFENTLADSFEVPALRNYAADLDATTTLTSDANVIKGINAGINSGFSVTVSGGLVVQLASDFNSSFSLQADVGKIRNYAADLDSNISLVANASKTTDIDIPINDFAAFNIEVNAIYDSQANAVAEFNLTSTVDGLVGIISDFTVSSTFDVEYKINVTQQGQAQLVGVFELDAVNSRLRNANSNLEASATVVADTNLQKSFEAEFTSQVTQQVSITVLKGSVVFEPLVVDSTLTANALRLVQIDSSPLVTSELQCAAERQRAVSAALNTTFILDGDVTRFLGEEYFVTSQLNATANFTADSTVTSLIEADLNVELSGELQASVSIEVNASLVAVIKKLVILERTTYVIPKEIRAYTIPNENREHKI